MKGKELSVNEDEVEKIVKRFVFLFSSVCVLCVCPHLKVRAPEKISVWERYFL